MMLIFSRDARSLKPPACRFVYASGARPLAGYTIKRGVGQGGDELGPEVLHRPVHVGVRAGQAESGLQAAFDVSANQSEEDFMAETAAILSPQKTVVLPAKGAWCPMAHMIAPEELRDLLSIASVLGKTFDARDLETLAEGAKDLDDLIEGLDLGRYHPNARWAEVVFRVGYAGDPIARDVVTWSGHELGELACAVIRQLDLQEEAVQVVQIGGLFNGGPLYVDAVHETVLRLAPRAQFVRLTVPPVIGGVLLGAAAAGIIPGSIRGQLIQSTEALLHTAGPAQA